MPIETTMNTRELLADYAHDAWSGWMEYMFRQSRLNIDGTVTIPQKLVERWERQSKTPYKDLPENEQNSDRHEADRMLSIIEKTKE